ncbi:hypothetical protein [Tumebacillus lipolyticus]|uniref:DUF2651 domain-containing protein n=1 Tax=Tumebacillus lipolyticus TaxID=1280370 RepID=A0ABW4ZYX3_9BACL
MLANVYFLAILSGMFLIPIVLAWLKRSWLGMLIIGIAMAPITSFFGQYPIFTWALFLPLIPLTLMIFLLVQKIRKKRGTTDDPIHTASDRNHQEHP